MWADAIENVEDDETSYVYETQSKGLDDIVSKENINSENLDEAHVHRLVTPVATRQHGNDTPKSERILTSSGDYNSLGNRSVSSASTP